MGNAIMYDTIGLLGVLLYISSYGALQLGRLDGNSLKYSALNGAAALLVLISLYKSFNLASALIQIVWITTSIFGLCRHLMAKQRSEGCDKAAVSQPELCTAAAQESQGLTPAQLNSKKSKSSTQYYLRKKQ